MPDQCRSRVAIGFAIIVLLGCGSAEARSRSALSGKIANASGPAVSVKLKSVRKSPLARYDGYSTTVGADGRFRFEDVEPGEYVLAAEGPRFMPAEYGASEPGQHGIPIKLTAGQHRKGLVLTLARKRVVCGRVTDEKGNPLAKVEVYVFAHRRGTSWLTFDDPEHMRTATDANGDYRLPDLEPGEYFLQAGLYTWFSSSRERTQIQAESLANAEAVEVGRDEGTQCREDIHTQPRTGYRGLHIRGTIADEPALAGKGVVLSLLEVSRTGASRRFPGPGEVFRPGQSFDLWGIPSGHYRLVLANGRFPQNWAGSPPEFHELVSQEVTLDDEDVNGIVLKADPLASLAGKVEFEGISPVAACPTREKPHISIQKADDGQFLQMELDAGRNFTLPAVALGTYTVRMYPFLRGTVYVKSMLFDGHAVEGRTIRIVSPGPHRLEVVLSGEPADAAGHLTPDEPVERYEAQWAHPKASVSGRITNVIPGNLPWVKLWAVRFNSDHSYEYTTKPAPDGSFRFENVDPGIYVLLTQGKDYTLHEYGASHPGFQGVSVTLKAGQHLEGVTLASSPKGSNFCGKVVDEAGHPVPRVPVFAWSQSKEGGHLALPGVAANDDGDFRFLDLKPGRYFFGAVSAAFTPAGEISYEHAGYFPSSPNLEGAQAVDVGFDPDTGCTHNIQMRTPPTFHIRGRLPESLPRAEGESFVISLSETNAAGAERWIQARYVRAPENSFDFAKVRPGQYRLRVSRAHKEAPGGDGRSVNISGRCNTVGVGVLASQEIHVGDGDADNVTIALNSIVAVSGAIRYEDLPKGWTAFKIDQQTVGLSHDNQFCGSWAHLTPEGEFAFAGVEAGPYSLDLGLRQPMYARSILLNGQPVEGRHITLQPGKPAKLTIEVSGKGAEVDAVVAPSAPPAEDYRYGEPCRPKMEVSPHVLLIPDAIPADGSGVLSGARNQNGQVVILGVPPGRYHAIAGENLNMLGAPATWKDPKLLRALAANGTAVEVAAGQKVSVTLRSSTAEVQDILAAQKQEVSTADHCAASCSYNEFWNGAEK